MFECIVSDLYRGLPISYNDCKTVWQYVDRTMSKRQMSEHINVHWLDIDFHYMCHNQHHLKPLVERALSKQIKY